jgi:hypothetical protein
LSSLSGVFLAKTYLFGQAKTCFFPPKLVFFAKTCFFWPKLVFFGQNLSFWSKLVKKSISSMKTFVRNFFQNFFIESNQFEIRMSARRQSAKMLLHFKLFYSILKTFNHFFFLLMPRGRCQFRFAAKMEEIATLSSVSFEKFHH